MFCADITTADRPSRLTRCARARLAVLWAVRDELQWPIGHSWLSHFHVQASAPRTQRVVRLQAVNKSRRHRAQSA
jgi:hypothetical protein